MIHEGLSFLYKSQHLLDHVIQKSSSVHIAISTCTFRRGRSKKVHTIFLQSRFKHLNNESNNHPTCFVHRSRDDQWKNINELYESGWKQVHT